jgi:hypothetical protein
MEPTASGKPIRTSAQWTPEQYAWLQARARRLGLRSVAAVVSMLVQEAMNAEYRANRDDVDVEQ